MRTDIEQAQLKTLYTTALHILGSSAAAEEAVATAYRNAMGMPGSSESGSRLKVLMRDVVSAARRTAAAVSSRDAMTWPRSAQARAARLLATLDVDLRSAVVLRDVAGLSRAEAAYALGTTPEKFGELLSEGRITLTEGMT